MPRKHLSSRKVVRLVVPPLLTLSASAFILIEASWLHDKYHHTAKPQATTAAGPVSNAVSPALLHPQHPSPIPSSQSGNSTGSDHHTTESTGDSTGTGTGTAAHPSGDEGFAPVSGGSLKPSPKPGDLNLSTALSSLVTQYGAAPVTSFDPQTMESQYGVNVQFNLPSNISEHQILLLPLARGVLWAIVPPTGMGANGAIGASTAPSQLFYTPYGGPDPSKVVLSADAPSLGALPVSVTGSEMTTSWYQPTAASTNSPAGGTTSGPMSVVAPPSGDSGTTTGTSTNSTGNTSEATNTPTAKPTADAAQVRTVADSQTNLYLGGLYKVDGGAVILIRAQSPTGVSQWAFLWNETKAVLKPICSITNSPSQFGWIAIGQHTVYWGQRHLVPPANIDYQGTQQMMTLATGRVRKIQLGTWTSEAEAGQDIDTWRSDPDQKDDELYFRIKNSPVWKEFVPSP